jgi:hypothetical protein
VPASVRLSPKNTALVILVVSGGAAPVGGHSQDEGAGRPDDEGPQRMTFHAARR